MHSCKMIFKLFFLYFNEFVFSEKSYGSFPNIKFNKILGLVAKLFHASGDS
jgi:hypothetical protein